MKKANCLILVAIAATVWLVAGPTSALEPIPQESGFSGFIQPGIGYLNFKSNMVASFMGYDLSDKRINSLTDSPDETSNGILLAPLSLQYTFASTRTQLFAGTDLIDLVRFDFSQQVGVKQGLGGFGILQGGFLISGLPAKVWKDPYVVNRNREETSRLSNGARLVWDRMFASGLQLQYTYRNIDISSERSGEFLGLSAAERKLLRRDGDQHAAEIQYRFTFAEKHQFAPAFDYAYDDRDGGAMKNDVYNFQLTYAYFGDPFSFKANARIGWADYDDRNPLYNKNQKSDIYGIQGTLYYKNPWNWSLFGSNPMNFYTGAAFAASDANIDFYDQEAILATAGVFFKW